MNVKITKEFHNFPFPWRSEAINLQIALPIIATLSIMQGIEENGEERCARTQCLS
jgi:hypothetical protein